MYEIPTTQTLADNARLAMMDVISCYGSSQLLTPEIRQTVIGVGKQQIAYDLAALNAKWSELQHLADEASCFLQVNELSANLNCFLETTFGDSPHE